MKLIDYTLLAIIAVLVWTTVFITISRYKDAKLMCLEEYGTAEYTLVDSHVWCEVDGKYIKVVEDE